MIYVVAMPHGYEQFCESREINPRDKRKVQRVSTVQDARGRRPAQGDQIIFVHGGSLDAFDEMKKREAMFS